MLQAVGFLDIDIDIQIYRPYSKATSFKSQQRNPSLNQLLGEYASFVGENWWAWFCLGWALYTPFWTAMAGLHFCCTRRRILGTPDCPFKYPLCIARGLASRLAEDDLEQHERHE